jgi:predicted pyridoxine 5'-phosphate oxidase superfamily flavin-nucleotide-binding protein
VFLSKIVFGKPKNLAIFATAMRERIATHIGEMAEWSIAAVLKTVDCNRSGGSNPSFSAEVLNPVKFFTGFFII